MLHLACNNSTSFLRALTTSQMWLLQNSIYECGDVIISTAKWTHIKLIIKNITSCFPFVMRQRTSMKRVNEYKAITTSKLRKAFTNPRDHFPIGTIRFEKLNLKK